MNSETPGLVPRVKHRAGGDDLDEVGAAVEHRAHPLAHLVGRVGHAESKAGGKGHVGGGADQLPPAGGDVTYAPATFIRGPITVPSLIASRSATSTKAR